MFTFKFFKTHIVLNTKYVLIRLRLKGHYYLCRFIFGKNKRKQSYFLRIIPKQNNLPSESVKTFFMEILAT